MISIRDTAWASSGSSCWICSWRLSVSCAPDTWEWWPRMAESESPESLDESGTSDASGSATSMAIQRFKKLGSLHCAHDHARSLKIHHRFRLCVWAKQKQIPTPDPGICLLVYIGLLLSVSANICNAEMFACPWSCPGWIIERKIWLLYALSSHV